LYTDRIKKRTSKVGGQSYGEEVLPVDSVQEYFEHFDTLEIDFTFYRLLLERDKKSPQSYQPTTNYHVLKKYRENMKEGDGVILKIPRLVFAKKIYRSGKYIENESYLDAVIFKKQFYEPAVKILGPVLKGFIFEQEYHRKKDRIPVEAMALDLDAFFDSIPKDMRYNIELRTESYLNPPIFEVMKKHRIGQVLSHWTWLPRLLKQFSKAGGQFFNPNQCMIRLITPLGMRYEQAYALAHPFDKMVEGMMQPEMLQETVKMIKSGIKKELQIYVLINNRAGGNAPLIAREIANHFLEKKGTG
jgi:uncharacterized protein YecE (DUF72 family)